MSWYTNESTALIAVVIPTIWKSYPFVTLTLLAAMQSIPYHLYEAAAVDGASAWERFAYIAWPGIRGQATLAMVLTACGRFASSTSSKPRPAAALRRRPKPWTSAPVTRRSATSTWAAAVIGVLMLAIALVAVLLARRQLRKEFF